MWVLGARHGVCRFGRVCMSLVVEEVMRGTGKRRTGALLPSAIRTSESGRTRTSHRARQETRTWLFDPSAHVRLPRAGAGKHTGPLTTASTSFWETRSPKGALDGDRHSSNASTEAQHFPRLAYFSLQRFPSRAPRTHPRLTIRSEVLVEPGYPLYDTLRPLGPSLSQRDPAEFGWKGKTQERSMGVFCWNSKRTQGT